MPGHSNQPDPNHTHGVPHTTSGTAGEFTQIFAAGAASQPTSAAGERPPFAPADDEFAKMFLAPAAPVGAPATPLQGTSDNEATLIFEALPSAFAPSKTVPAAPLPAVPSRGVATAPPAAPRTSESPSTEFTQIFSPVAPPAAPLPEVKQAARPLAPPSGEFTQFFSAISARESSSAPPVASLTQRAQGSTPFPAARDMPEVTAKSMDDFDRMFPQGAVRAAEPAFDRSGQPAPAPTPLPDAAQSTGAGAFTQVFQQIAPPQTRAEAAVLPHAPAKSSPPQAPPQFSGPASIGSPEQWPAFGPPPQQSGTFTDVFAAQPSSGGGSWPAAPAATAPSSQGSGFTELFQAMPAAPQSQPAASPFSNPGTSSAPGASAAAWTMPQHAPAPQASSMAAGGGDFTRLMQSLTPSAQRGAPTLPQNDAFFAASPGVGSSAHQESEFTRVQRASSRREAGGAAPASAPPAAGAAVAPGLAMAPPKEKAPEKDAPAKKSKTLVILLVAMNILLLLALIIIAFLVLRRK